jgi:hypothetical protein
MARLTKFKIINPAGDPEANIAIMTKRRAEYREPVDA